MNEKLIEYIKKIIEKYCYCDWKENSYGGCFHYQIYADYRDEGFDNKTLIELCEMENPVEAFNERLIVAYEQHCFDIEDEIIRNVRTHWASEEFSWSEHEDEISDWIRCHLVFEYPTDHYLNQKVTVDIIVDTGDGDFDFVSNDVYPHYDGEYGKPVPEEASILWLTRQQGYNKRQLNRALRHKEYSESKFLESVREEILNCSSHMNALTFLSR